MLKRFIHIFSLCFLYCGFWLNVFSITVTVISLKLCSFRLKCSPFALSVTFDVTYSLCSKNLSFKVLSVSPMYYWVHFLHQIKYTTLLEVQLTLVLISTFILLDVDFTIFPSFMNGQTPQFKHLFMPGMILFALEIVGFGTFALISLSFMFGGLL